MRKKYKSNKTNNKLNHEKGKKSKQIIKRYILQTNYLCFIFDIQGAYFHTFSLEKTVYKTLRIYRSENRLLYIYF